MVPPPITPHSKPRQFGTPRPGPQVTTPGKSFTPASPQWGANGTHGVTGGDTAVAAASSPRGHDVFPIKPGARGATAAALGELCVYIGSAERSALQEQHSTAIQLQHGEGNKENRTPPPTTATTTATLGGGSRLRGKDTDRGNARQHVLWTEDEDRGINEHVQRHLGLFDDGTLQHIVERALETQPV